MKACVYRRYGGPEVLEFADVPKPSPKDDEILVEVRATTVTAADWRARTLEMPRGFGLMGRLAFGVRRPRQPVLGSQFAGVVEAVGARVTRFRPGDAVFGMRGWNMGCHAEYVVARAEGPVAPKPDGVSFDEAASLCFGGTTALHFLRRADVKRDERVLVIGASGEVGTALVQLANHLGAIVTGVTSTRNLDIVTSLGADRVVDYTKQDALASGETYDVVADTVGNTSFARCKAALRENGRMLAIAAGLPDILAGLAAASLDSRRIIAGPAPELAADVRRLAELAGAGVLRPVIDRRYDFAGLPEAHAYVATRRKRGSVVVTLARET